jgi:hypothetical protein
LDRKEWAGHRIGRTYLKPSKQSECKGSTRLTPSRSLVNSTPPLGGTAHCTPSVVAALLTRLLLAGNQYTINETTRTLNGWSLCLNKGPVQGNLLKLWGNEVGLGDRVKILEIAAVAARQGWSFNALQRGRRVR